VIIGGKVAGAIGMLFAVPLTGIIKVTFLQVIWGLKNYSLHAISPLKEDSFLKPKGGEAV